MEEKHFKQTIIKPLIQKEIRHIRKPIIQPYIYKNGDFIPYELKSNKNNPKITEKIITVNFISSNHNINYPMPCKNTDIFSNIEKKLYLKFPNLKLKTINFIANGNIVNKSSTFEQNRIKSGDNILINEIK